MKTCFRHTLCGIVYENAVTKKEVMICHVCHEQIEIVVIGRDPDGTVLIREKNPYGVPDFLIRAGWTAFVPILDPDRIV